MECHVSSKYMYFEEIWPRYNSVQHDNDDNKDYDDKSDGDDDNIDDNNAVRCRDNTV